MTDYNNINLTFDGAIAQLTIDRPKAMNALNTETLSELGLAIEEVRGSDVRVLIVTGGGKAFVAGADISQMVGFNPEEAVAFSHQGHAVLRALEVLPIPVIAAINGFALGGGCELAMACDIIYASEKARFGQPEVKLGLIPGFGGTQRLSRLVGTQMARELIYTGRMIGAQEALRIGLVARLLPPDELMSACQDLAKEIVAVGPLAVEASKRVVLEGYDRPLTEANALEAQAFADLFENDEPKVGMTAFLEKRSPKF